MAVRVVLVDDHPVVRTGLAALLRADGRLDVVGEAGDAAGALALVDRMLTTSEALDLVFMDLHLGGGMGGIEATAQLTRRGVAVLVVTTFDSDADIMGALDAGARGYLLKDSPTEQLVDAALAAAAGCTVLSPEIQARLVLRTVNPARSLSEREVEVLQQVAAGATNREVARALFISESTVKTHLAHLFEKLGVDNRTALVAAARERRLIR